MKINPKDLNWTEAHDIWLVRLVAPRPIALVSTVGEDGVLNMAPFSFHGVMCVKPMLVYIAIGRQKDTGAKTDTLRNIEFSKDFVINVVDESLAQAMDQSAVEYPSDVDEFKEVGLTPAKSDLVEAPRIAESPVNMECRLKQILEFGDFPEHSKDPKNRYSVVIGEVVRIHVKDEVCVNGEIQMSKLGAIGRLGEGLYCRTTDTFRVERKEVSS